MLEVRRRIHQRAFRERVLVAYGGKCAFCTLGYRELLDAAHIIPDSELRGEPVVSNGMSLCRLHHAACGVWADDFGGSAGLHHSGAGRRFGGGGWADVEARASGVGGAADCGAEQAGGSAGCGEVGGEVGAVFGRRLNGDLWDLVYMGADTMILLGYDTLI